MPQRALARVVVEFQEQLGPQTTLPVAAIKALTGVIRRSHASTVMGMERELREAANLLIDNVKLDNNSTIALNSGCELFLRYVTRTSLDIPDFERCKALLLERGERFAEMSLSYRDKIASLGQGFVRDGSVVMTLGVSRVCTSLLLRAAKTKHFSIIITECRPDSEGFKAAEVFGAAGIPTEVILDSAVGYYMEQVDLVIVGAEGVAENGGVINKIGTFGMAIIAKAFNKPVYVAAESYKFARLFPLNQQDLPKGRVPSIQIDPPVGISKGNYISSCNPCVDYTPAEYIQLLITDLGILTPSAVSDELIKLYS